MHWLHRHRLLLLGAIAAFATLIVTGLRFAVDVPFLSAVWKGQQAYEDLLRREGRKTKTHDDFVFIGIDQQSLQFNSASADEIAGSRGLQLISERPFPWPREIWAVLLDKLFAAGARMVILDLIFNAANDGDPFLHEALEKYRDRVVVGFNIDVEHGNELVGPNATLIAPPPWQDDRVGFVNYWPDGDGEIRRLQFHITEHQLTKLPAILQEETFDHLITRALGKLGRSNVIAPDISDHDIRFSSPAAYPPYSLYELFVPKFWHMNYQDGAFFKNKIVIVGPSAQVLQDVHPTPVDIRLPGPVLHLHALAAALDRDFLSETPLAVDFAAVIGAGILAWVVVACVRRPFPCLLSLLAVGAAYVVISRVLYDSRGLFIVVVPALSAFISSGLFGLGFEYTLERLEKVRTRRTLERYVSKNLVKEILDNPSGYYSSMLGSRKPVTVLFSDLVGFTTLSERADPAALVSQLNRYLSAMVPMVFDNGGTLDKFIGDAMMAVWGNVSSRGAAEDAKAAVRAALGMRKMMAKLNEEWRSEGFIPLAFGIGINHGDAVVGNIGSYAPHERLDPTVIGDAVNLASRLEALTRQYRLDILIGASAAELVRDEFHLRLVDLVQVKGKTKPVDVFTLVGGRKDDIDPELLKWLQSYQEGIKRFRGRQFTEAKIVFSQFLEFYPDDTLAKMYLERALEYEQTPPDEAWNAVEVFRKK